MVKRVSFRKRLLKRHLRLERLERRDLLAVTFEFNYRPGEAVGFNDPELGAGYRVALQSAANRLGSWLLHDAVIEMDVRGYAFDGTAIGGAASVGGIRPAAGGFVHHLIPEKILNGNDANGPVADGHVDIYFFGPDDTFSYQIDPSQGIADDEIDFQAVVIHEIAHTFGFTSATQASGTDDNGDGVFTPGAWTVFDQFVSDVNGNRFIDADPTSPTAFQMDVPSWLTHSVGGKGPDAGLFFDGPVTKSVYGDSVPLYSPSTFRLESSVAHLDSEGYPNESYLFSPVTHLMSHTLVDRAVPQEFTLLEKAILTDLGYRVRESVPPVINAPDGLSIEANHPGGYNGPNTPITDFLAAVEVTDQLDPQPTLTHSLPNEYTLGDHLITLQATDLSGNQTTRKPVLSIVDSTPPALTVAPAMITVEATSHQGYRFAELNFNTEVNDIVDLDPIVTHNAPEYIPLGSNSVTFLATDFSQNQSSQTVQIMVQDTTPPVFSPPPQIQIASNEINGANLSDLSSLRMLQSFASDIADDELGFAAAPDSLPFGTSSVLFSAFDDSGNQTDATILVEVIERFDFGDAPNDYPVRLARDGARHQPSDLYLGRSIDFDLDGITSHDATGDLLDEDGVQFLSTPIVTPSGGNLTGWAIESTQTGYVDAWIDFNQDNHWDMTQEKVLDSVPVDSGNNLLSLTLPAETPAGETFARVRLSGSGDLQPIGQAPDGEVEDYQITLVASDINAAAEISWIQQTANLSLQEGRIEFLQQQVISFSASNEDVGIVEILGDGKDQSIIVDWNSIALTTTPKLIMDGQLGTNTIQWVGERDEINLVDQTDWLLTGFQQHDLTAIEPQSLVLDRAAVNRLSPETKQLVINLGIGDLVEVGDQGDWRLVEPRNRDGEWFLPATNLLNPAMELQVTPISYWNNYVLHSDINNDGGITATDALIIINELSTRRFSDRETQLVKPVSDNFNWPDRYFDQNLDQRITALDALRVINDLNRLNLSGPNGEQISLVVQQERIESQTPAAEFSQPLFPYDKRDWDTSNAISIQMDRRSLPANRYRSASYNDATRQDLDAAFATIEPWWNPEDLGTDAKRIRLPPIDLTEAQTSISPQTTDRLLASSPLWADKMMKSLFFTLKTP